MGFGPGEYTCFSWLMKYPRFAGSPDATETCAHGGFAFQWLDGGCVSHTDHAPALRSFTAILPRTGLKSLTPLSTTLYE